ncbi:PLDc N-terminal domain-containing protein [Microbacterium luticocti]|uniref:PLDc N-terminal domain-containing protein n=1 Tax=Microbacterium luticocti TaxID=451764 RepID=UPI00040CD00B|nr:PLDc N-terminal domain-containing protein [Microbacterium luticocti]
MARLLLILAFVAVIFWVFSVVDVAVQPAERHRGVGRPMWIVIVVVFPVIGGVLWFVVGRTAARARPVVAPDDDPEFLRRLGTHPVSGRREPESRADLQERLRLLEQELKGLDSDDDDPPAGPGRAR